MVRLGMYTFKVKLIFSGAYVRSAAFPVWIGYFKKNSEYNVLGGRKRWGERRGFIDN